MDLARFKELPLLGILRGIEREMVAPIGSAARAAGLQALEVTMNTPGAAALIRAFAGASGQGLTVGAGTVLTLEDLHAALDAGATFIVLPTVVEEVVNSCTRRGIPCFPGALTPREIYHAWQLGASMVKVFPAKCFGPEYFREIRGPFGDVELLACGGVHAGTLRSYFECGASAVAFGGSIFNRNLLKERAYDRIEASLRQLVQTYRDWWESLP
jgi:2-dehydro-3-deoxyphosphogluconate aldolase/(4S)-4-hydroxy-2-oxoglutarate aldolase